MRSVDYIFHRNILVLQQFPVADKKLHFVRAYKLMISNQGERQIKKALPGQYQIDILYSWDSQLARILFREGRSGSSEISPIPSRIRHDGAQFMPPKNLKHDEYYYSKCSEGLLICALSDYLVSALNHNNK